MCTYWLAVDPSVTHNTRSVFAKVYQVDTLMVIDLVIDDVAVEAVPALFVVS
jgi:hypothetical protein